MSWTAAFAQEHRFGTYAFANFGRVSKPYREIAGP